VIIIDPTVEERQVDSLMEKYLKVITDEKGTVDNVDVTLVRIIFSSMARRRSNSWMVAGSQVALTTT
jgi:small subunit ribosomal protein S6